jgi:hypothetical protein
MTAVRRTERVFDMRLLLDGGNAGSQDPRRVDSFPRDPADDRMSTRLDDTVEAELVVAPIGGPA